jgi:hypothetical protein
MLARQMTGRRRTRNGGNPIPFCQVSARLLQNLYSAHNPTIGFSLDVWSTNRTLDGLLVNFRAARQNEAAIGGYFTASTSSVASS